MTKAAQSGDQDTPKPPANDAPSGPAQTGPAQDPAQTGPAQTGPAQTGPINDGATGPASTGPAETGPAQTGPAQPETSLDKIKKAAEDAVEAWKKNPTPELKAAAEKAVAEARAALKGALASAPEKYELTMPKDSTLDASHLERIAAEAKAQGLSNEEAQALLERDSQLHADFTKKEKEKVEGYITQWAQDAMNDKEVGGQSFKENAEISFRFIKHYGTPELVKFLEDTGLGNHPEVMRVVVRAAKDMGVDKFVQSGKTGEPAKTMAETFYGSDNGNNNQQ